MEYISNKNTTMKKAPYLNPNEIEDASNWLIQQKEKVSLAIGSVVGG